MTRKNGLGLKLSDDSTVTWITVGNETVEMSSTQFFLMTSAIQAEYENMNRMVDIRRADNVEVQRGPHGELWVNVDNVCRLRVNRLDKLDVQADTSEEVE
jgi:hypothetical protein